MVGPKPVRSMSSIKERLGQRHMQKKDNVKT